MHPPEEAWQAWSPAELAAYLGATGGWYVVGGWALDLWHGRQTRPHEDLEIAALPERIADLCRALPELDFFAVEDGALTPFPENAAPAQDLWQIWAADPAAACWRFDLMIERGTPALWQYKRDPSLVLPRAQAVRRTQDGIAYLAPALVLLFKAKYRRDKDERDFERALPHLEPQERDDLRMWLERLHPDHGWLSALRAAR